MSFFDLFDGLNKEPKAPKGTVLTYSDGAANLYFITTTLIEYAPMTPERSSSGFYSGGEPATVAITTEEFEQIYQTFKQAQANKEDHSKNRMKGCGYVSGDLFLLKREFFPSFSLVRNSTSQNALEEILKRLLKNNCRS